MADKSSAVLLHEMSFSHRKIAEKLAKRERGNQKSLFAGLGGNQSGLPELWVDAAPHESRHKYGWGSIRGLYAMNFHFLSQIK